MPVLARISNISRTFRQHLSTSREFTKFTNISTFQHLWITRSVGKFGIKKQIKPKISLKIFLLRAASYLFKTANLRQIDIITEFWSSKLHSIYGVPYNTPSTPMQEVMEQLFHYYSLRFITAQPAVRKLSLHFCVNHFLWAFYAILLHAKFSSCFKCFASAFEFRYQQVARVLLILLIQLSSINFPCFMHNSSAWL